MSKEAKEPKSTPKRIPWWVHAILLAAIVAIVSAWWFFPSLITLFNVHHTRKGEFGDQFGALNTLFTGLAFALLIYTAILQFIELGYQRQDFTETREVFKEQKALQKAHLQFLEDEREARDRQYVRENSPILVIMNQKRRTHRYEVWILNGGAPIHRLLITTLPKHAVNHSIDEPILLDRDGIVRIEFAFEDFDATKLHDITFTLSYIDYTGETIEKELRSMRQTVIN